MKNAPSLTCWLMLPCITLIAGCASPARPEGMIAQKVPRVEASHDPVVVLVTGGAKTDPMWMSKIAADDFKNALLGSLRKSGLFKSAEAAGSGPYRLEVRLEVLHQPLMGFNMTVSLRADWRLMQSKEDRELWHERIVSSHTATVGDAFAAVKRVRVANEGAARKNIEEGLAKLAALEFKP